MNVCTKQRYKLEVILKGNHMHLLRLLATLYSKKCLSAIVFRRAALTSVVLTLEHWQQLGWRQRAGALLKSGRTRQSRTPLGSCSMPVSLWPLYSLCMKFFLCFKRSYISLALVMVTSFRLRPVDKAIK